MVRGGGDGVPVPGAGIVLWEPRLFPRNVGDVTTTDAAHDRGNAYRMGAMVFVADLRTAPLTLSR
jgi:hypothetical protein